MKTNDLFLKNTAAQLPVPKNFFSGRCLNSGFSLPDNIIVFFRDFIMPGSNSHGRHTLMIPMDDMIYLLNERKITLSPEEFLYIPPYAVRFLYPESAGFRRIFITFDVKGSQSYLPQAGAYRLGDNRKYLNKFIQSYISGTIEDASFDLMKFLSLQKSSECRVGSESELPKIIVKVISRIESDISNVCDIESLADFVDISESRLRALFRQHIGVSIGRFIAGKKMDCARNALQNSNASITEIAQNCGFANVYVFSAFFKRNAGIAPLHYRKNCQTKGSKRLHAIQNSI